jgi:hypothetical protein
MEHLEFMQSFDGTQEIPSLEEQVRATRLFKTIVQDALFAFPDNIEYTSASSLGDRAPRLELYPIMSIPVQSATIAQVYNPRGSNAYIHLRIPQEDNIIGAAFYNAHYESPLRRYDVEDLIESRKRAAEASSRSENYIKEQDANKALERELGINDGIVGYGEVLGLRALILCMMPRLDTPNN